MGSVQVHSYGNDSGGDKRAAAWRHFIAEGAFLFWLADDGVLDLCMALAGCQ